MKIDVAFFDQALAHALLRFGQPKEIAQGMRRVYIWKHLFKNRSKSFEHGQLRAGGKFFV